MSLENRGIPTVVVCTAPFLDSALIHAKVNHETVADVPRITTRHEAPQIAARFESFLRGES